MVQIANETNMLDTIRQMKEDGTFEQLSCIVLDENFVPSRTEFCSRRKMIGTPNPGIFEHEEAMVKKHAELCEKIDATYPEDIKIFAFGGSILPCDELLERVEYIFTNHNDIDVFMAAFFLGAKGASHIKKGRVVDNNLRFCTPRTAELNSEDTPFGIPVSPTVVEAVKAATPEVIVEAVKSAETKSPIDNKPITAKTGKEPYGKK